jgi:hypothetical protein
MCLLQTINVENKPHDVRRFAAERACAKLTAPHSYNRKVKKEIARKGKNTSVPCIYSSIMLLAQSCTTIWAKATSCGDSTKLY